MLSEVSTRNSLAHLSQIIGTLTIRYGSFFGSSRSLSNIRSRCSCSRSRGKFIIPSSVSRFNRCHVSLFLVKAGKQGISLQVSLPWHLCQVNSKQLGKKSPSENVVRRSLYQASPRKSNYQVVQQERQAPYI